MSLIETMKEKGYTLIAQTKYMKNESCRLVFMDLKNTPRNILNDIDLEDNEEVEGYENGTITIFINNKPLNKTNNE